MEEEAAGVERATDDFFTSKDMENKSCPLASLGKQVSAEGVECTAASKKKVSDWKNEAAEQKLPKQNDELFWSQESRSEEAALPDNSSYDKMCRSTFLRTRQDRHQELRELQSLPAGDRVDISVSRQDRVETPLFVEVSKEDGFSTAPAKASPSTPVPPASQRQEGVWQSVSLEQVLSPAAMSRQRGEQPALQEEPSNKIGKAPPVENGVTSSEQNEISDKKVVPCAADAVDGCEIGNEQASGSSWCFSLSTSSDTRSDTHHVLQSLELPREKTCPFQRPTSVPVRPSPEEKTIRHSSRTRASASASMSPTTTEDHQSPMEDGLSHAELRSENGKKDCYAEPRQASVAYGRAKIAADVLVGLTGMQSVSIVTCFTFDSPLGGVVSLFCFFSSAFAHFDERPASYFLCALLAFFQAVIFVVALCSKLAGFENFYITAPLHRVMIAHATVLILTSLIASGLGGRAVRCSTALRGRNLDRKLSKPPKIPQQQA